MTCYFQFFMTVWVVEVFEVKPQDYIALLAKDTRVQTASALSVKIVKKKKKLLRVQKESREKCAHIQTL